MQAARERSLTSDPVARLLWTGFAVLVAINVVWLVMTMRSTTPSGIEDEAYAECRAAVRRLRPEASRIPFPTRDLVRVSRRDSMHHTVRGYYELRAAGGQRWYRCEVNQLPGVPAWKVDSVLFER